VTVAFAAIVLAVVPGATICAFTTAVVVDVELELVVVAGTVAEVVVSGGQAVAHPPVQVLVPTGSGLYSYRVWPSASTSVSPSFVLVTLTTAASVGVLVGAAVVVEAEPP